MTEAMELPTNSPPADADPLTERLSETYAQAIANAEALVDALGRVPDILDAATAVKATSFVRQIKDVKRKLDDARKAEKEPFLTAGRSVDGFFATWTAALEAAARTVEQRLSAFQRQLEAEERQRREEEAKRAREEAERLAKAAATPIDDARAAQAAEQAAAAQRQAEAKTADLVRTHGAYGGVATTRTTWQARVVDRKKLDWKKLGPLLDDDAIMKAARAFVRLGGRECKGLEIYEETKAVVR